MSLRTPAHLQLLALPDRVRQGLNTTDRRNRPSIQICEVCGPESVRSYSRTEDRAPSTRPQHIPGRRPKDTPDTPLLVLAAR
jgi:hypothetical protein